MYLLRHVGLYGFNGSERVYMVSEMAWTGSRAQHRYVRGNTYIFLQYWLVPLVLLQELYERAQHLAEILAIIF